MCENLYEQEMIIRQLILSIGNASIYDTTSKLIIKTISQKQVEATVDLMNKSIDDATDFVNVLSIPTTSIDDDAEIELELNAFLSDVEEPAHYDNLPDIPTFLPKIRQTRKIISV